MHTPFRTRSGNLGRNRGINNSGKTGRRCRFEALESRQLLSITLPALSNVTLPAGTTMYVPLSGTAAGQTLSYAVTASDYSQVTPVIMPASNKTLEFDVDVNGTTETMDFQLFDNLAPATTAAIEALVNSGFYNGLQIYRNATTGGVTFCLQGGNDPPSGPIKTDAADMAEEFSPNLEYTAPGMLGMARSDPGTSSSEFFITGEATRSLDFNYTIFGMQTSGFDVFNTIAAMPNDPSSQNGEYLLNPVTITSASIITTSQTGMLQISAPAGVTGTVQVTVTASDGTDTPVTQSFTVTTAADDPSNPANPFSAVIPATPSALSFVPANGGSSTATTSNNSSSSSALQFLVSGVTSGDVVEILCDGNVIGQATATDTSVTVTTDGVTTLSDGAHSFTAIQIAESQTVSVNESTSAGGTTALSKTADVPSFNSAAVQVTVDTTAPVFNFPQANTAVVGVPYTCQVSVSDSTSVTYSLTGTPPSGMAIDANTGMITWTPSQTGTDQVNVQAVDLAGNTASTSYSINVLASNAAPVLTAASPSLGTINSDKTATIALATFINGGSGTTTQITDSDTNPAAVLGGIAIVGTTGSGTWSYILNGTTTPVAIGSVSASSALLLPHDASLSYAPSGASENATITYHAWDTTGGAATGYVDLSGTNATGGSTAYSTATDTASLTVVNTSSISGYVYVGDGQLKKMDATHAVLQGVVITLSLQNGSSWADVAKTMTDKNGYYHFDDLAAGTYQVTETQPTIYLDGEETLGTIGGVSEGTTGANQFSITLADGDNATCYNFGELGLKVQYISLSMSLASSLPSDGGIVARDYPPVVDLSQSAKDYSVSYAAGTAATAIAASTATVSDSDSAYLASMTATITNLQDGASETLAATTTGTSITAAYADGVLTLTGVDTPADYQQVLQSIVYSDTASSPQVGQRTITVVANDGIANSQVATAVVSVVQGPGCTVTPGNSLINANEATATSFTMAGAPLGATFNYTITSDGGSGQVTGTGTITDSTTQTVSNVDVSSLPNGTLTYSVTLTSGGVTGVPATATATLDTTAPSGYNITANDANVGAAKAASTGFTFTGAETGDTYTYKITSSGSTTASLTNTGTITSPNQVVGNIDVSSLPDGTLTYDVYLTDPAGNQGSHVQATAVLDQTAPAAFTVTPTDSLIGSSKATSTGFTIDGGEAFTTYSYTITSDGDGNVKTVTGSGTLTLTTQTISGIDVSSLPDGNLTFTVTLTDAAGNSTTETAHAILDTIAPSDYSITAIDANLNAAKAAATGFTFSGAEIGATYTYTITSSGSATASLTNTGTITSQDQIVNNIDVSSLPDGTLTYDVYLTDAAGNQGVHKTASAVLDRVAPAAFTVTPTDSLIGSSKATSTGFTIDGGEAFTTYSYTITSDGDGNVKTVTASGTLTLTTQTIGNIDVSSLPDGNLTFTVTLTDAAGNSTTETAHATLDTTTP
ncbi:MAG: peptidylprolyl isomerase [Thermoguttaceae bacterium]